MDIMDIDRELVGTVLVGAGGLLGAIDVATLGLDIPGDLIAAILVAAGMALIYL
jgi:hypothetical protein